MCVKPVPVMFSDDACKATLQHLIAGTLAPDRRVSVGELLADLAGCDDLRNGAAALDSLDQLTVARPISEFFELEKAGIEQYLLRYHRLDQWSALICESLELGELTHLWFRSGGTTGESRLVSQSIAHLSAETARISKLVAGSKRVVSLVPLNHIYGFIWGPLLSDQLGVPLIHGPEALSIAHQGLRNGDLLVAMPEWWHYLGQLRAPIPKRVTGVTSTAPCPAQVIESALERGLDSMIEVYGSSETAGIGWRNDIRRAFQLFDHWHRQDNDHIVSVEGGVYWLPDEVKWDTDRSLCPVRRRDGAIQIAGTNVWPDRVRAFIEQHPRVSACAVRPMETAQGKRLKAFFVPVDACADDVSTELQAWINARLPPAERPVQLTQGKRLPRNPMGKLCDW